MLPSLSTFRCNRSNDETRIQIYTVALRPSDFGIADLLNNSLQLIVPILTISISDAVFRFSLDKNVSHQELLANGLKVLSLSYLLVCAYWGFSYLFNFDFYWYLFGLLYLTESLKTLFAQFTRGLGKVKEYAVNGIISAVFLLASSYVFLKIYNLGVDGYLLAFIVANLASLLYLLLVCRIGWFISFKSSNKLLLRGMIAFSLPLTPNMLSWWITNISSRYIIALFSGLSLSGIFAAASKIPALINVVSSIFQLSWQFASVKEYQTGKQSEFYTTVLHFYTISIILIGAIIIAIIPYISLFILKGEFFEAWKLTPLLLYSSILGCLSIFFGTFYAVVKENKKALITTFVGAMANLAICFASIPFIGVAGALIANVVSYMIVVYMRYKDAKSYFEFQWDLRKTIISFVLLFCESVLMMLDTPSARGLSYVIVLALVLLYLKDIMLLINKTKSFMQKKLFTHNG